jgi:tetratricopeptide (TPR) repeat protein
LDYHLRNSEEINYKTAQSYNNVGAEYRDLKQYDKAIEYITKACEIAEKLGDDMAIATYLNRLGRTYAAMGDVETARTKFHAAIALLPKDHSEAIDSRERLDKLIE